MNFKPAGSGDIRSPAISRAGQGRAGQGRAGQGRAGQNRTGQGQLSAGQEPPFTQDLTGSGKIKEKALIAEVLSLGELRNLSRV